MCSSGRVFPGFLGRLRQYSSASLSMTMDNSSVYILSGCREDGGLSQQCNQQRGLEPQSKHRGRKAE